ncbi:uncharacterized protein LOC108151087 [Drosophila miranda]|uniref:uncharacterized protein LOC108151087 n=1 Tax=Drosophila miranda TaxID=7229 RepID=UPI0007E5EFE2|nr:uncharacterized protein LOC108151087 [Drosophila miranda]
MGSQMMERIRLRELAEAQARACRVPLHLQPQIVNMGDHTVQYPPTAQIQGRSGRNRRLVTGVQRTTLSGRANYSPSSGESKQLVTALTLAAAKTAAAEAAAKAAAEAAAPRPAKAPAGAQMRREFLTRVAGLARRGQPPVTKASQLKTPLARPVPNKKMPRTEARNLRVLENSTVTTGENGDTGALTDQNSGTHAQGLAEVSRTSFTYFGGPDDDVDDLLTEHRFPARPAASRGSFHSDKAYDAVINSTGDETPAPTSSDVPIASALLVASDQAAVEALTESYQKLNEMVVELNPYVNSSKETTYEQLAAVSSVPPKDQKKIPKPLTAHLKKELQTLTLMNRRMRSNLKVIIGPLDRTEAGGPPQILPKPSTNTITGGKAKEAKGYESSSSYYTPSTSFRSMRPSLKKSVAIRKIEYRHVENKPMMMQEPRIIAKAQSFGMIEEYNLQMNSMMETESPKPDPATDLDTDTDSDAEMDQGIPLLPTPAPVADSNADSRRAGAAAYSDLIQEMSPLCRIVFENLGKNSSLLLSQLRPLVNEARAINDKEKDSLARSVSDLAMGSIQSASTGSSDAESPFCEFLASLYSGATSLTSDGILTPSMVSCLSTTGISTPSMVTCLTPNGVSTPSMVTCLTSNGNSTQAPEHKADIGLTPKMVERLLVTTLSSLHIPTQVHSGTQTEIPRDRSPPATPRRSSLMAKNWKSRLLGGRAKLSKLPPPEIRASTQHLVVDNKGVEIFKKVLVGTLQMFLFIMLILVCVYPEIRCLKS